MESGPNNRSAAADSRDALSRRDFVKEATAVTGGLSLAAFLASCAGSSHSSPTTTGARLSTIGGPQGTPRKGGNFRVAVGGAGTAETLNPTGTSAPIDYCRAGMCFEPLIRLGGTGTLEYVLAQELTPNKDFTQYTLKLRPGVMWHDGKPLTVDDVIWTMRSSLLVKPWATFSAGIFSSIDPNGFKKIDPVTLLIKLTRPNSLLAAELTESYGSIYQNGVTSFNHPIGTGPWKFVSWTRGERASYARNDDWWGSGPKGPNFDTIETISINDATARLNALMAGEVDAIDSPAISQVPEITSNSRLNLIENRGELANSIAMATQSGKTYVKGAGEVTNNLVRQALRYLTPRQEILESVWSGHARIANDLHDWADPDYEGMIPQRPYDPEKAKSLLKQAGISSLANSTFVFGDFSLGLQDTCTLLASACQKAGFPLPTKIVPSSSYFSTYWPNKYPMSVDYWKGRPIAEMWRVSLIPGAAFNETNWLNPAFAKIYLGLTKTGDPSLQKELYYTGQKLLYDEGGYIIPVFQNFLQATSHKVINISTGIVYSFNNWDFVPVSFT